MPVMFVKAISQGSSLSLANVPVSLIEGPIGSPVWICESMLGDSRNSNAVAALTCRGPVSKIPPKATARPLEARTTAEARERMQWPPASARGAISTGGMLVYFSPSDAADEEWPRISSVQGWYRARYRVTTTQSGSMSIAIAVGVNEKMNCTTSRWFESVGRPGSPSVLQERCEGCPT